MPHPDQKYIEALLNNDRMLLDELYRKFSGKIKWMVLKNNGTEAEAADIFQDALMAIFKKASLHEFILTCPLDAFLYLICKKKWLNELDKKKFNLVTTSEDDGFIISEDSFKLAEDFTFHEERLNLITEKLEELGDVCRQLLHLSWAGKPMEEVAQITGLTYGYARKKKSECMTQLITLVKTSSRFNSLK